MRVLQVSQVTIGGLKRIACLDANTKLAGDRGMMILALRDRVVGRKFTWFRERERVTQDGCRPLVNSSFTLPAQLSKAVG